MTQYAQPPLFGTTQALEDEVEAFWAEAPRRTPIATARITCRVCELKAIVTEEVPISSAGLLCSHCRENLDETERYIRGVVRGYEIRFVNAYDLHQANVAHADEGTQARYERVLEALGAAHEGTVDAGSVKRRYEAAKAKGDELSALLKEKEGAEGIALEYQRVQAWAERGLEEVGAAR